MYDDVKVVLVLVAMLLLIIAVAVGCGLIESYFEAKAFNELTGSAVSARQAFFVELRIQEQIIEPNK